MDATAILGMVLGAAAVAYALITRSRSYAAARQREAEFFARRLHVGR